MDHSILRVLAAEVHRRTCPGCGRSLRDADISAHFSADERVQLSFRCGSCRFEGGGEIALTPEIYEEVAASDTKHPQARQPSGPEPPGPITADDVLNVHEILSRWYGGFPQLLDPEADLL